MLSREDYRKIKNMSKEEMSRWLGYEQQMIDNRLRKSYNDAYKYELDNSIQNFIIAILYTLHYSEETHIQNDELASFMDDLFVTVDYFRTGEYKPEDYRAQLEADGATIPVYDYDKPYRKFAEGIKRDYLPYKERNEKAIKQIEDFMANNNNPSCNFGDLQLLESILRGDL